MKFSQTPIFRTMKSKKEIKFAVIHEYCKNSNQTLASIADKFNTSKQTVSAILTKYLKKRYEKTN